MLFFRHDPYPHVVDFIDAAVDSEEITRWLADLEREPENMRLIRLAEIKSRMEYANAPGEHIDIILLMNKHKILEAMNTIIQDVRQSGQGTKRYIRKKGNNTYNILLGLIAAVKDV